MKKITFSAIVMIGIAVFGISCTKTQTTTADPGSGMITLELEVNNRESNDTLTSVDTDELVPSGTVVQFVMNTADYQENPDPNFNYDNKTWIGTVDGSGMVSMSLPAISDNATVTVKFPDLSLIRTWRLPASGNLLARDTSNTRIYEKADEVYTIFDGADVKVLQLMYNLK